ncbi:MULTISPECIES: hypothetical protein [unclassified Herbaspirillum]|uniref:hypothetical protein n=1 Tax=unclassified Herbaspirillum TaxID=2624150 RepID=UPI0017E9B8A0|nr:MULTISPECIES: hypothetical protein [unclassified Herbaspirillum]MBB5390511.1 membrane protein implicated in regulation of membrane protease activity [Herbaspirillum sp. SJZ102]
MATAFFGVAAVAVLAVDFTALVTAAVALAAGLAAIALGVFAIAADFTVAAAFVLFTDAAGVFAGFFIAFAIESTAN